MKMRVALAGLALGAFTALLGADNVLTPQEKAQGWVLLFDGKTLNGWESTVPPSAGRGGGRKGGGGAKKAAQPGAAPQTGSNPRACSPAEAQVTLTPGASHWEVVDGLITPCGEQTGYLGTTKDYANFVLQVDFLTGEDTNSGVFIRSPEENGVRGYEVQIWKAQPAGYNTGSIVNAGKTDKEYKFLADQWNHYEITADGDHLVIVLNGTKTLDIHDSQFANGRIRLQYQRFPIQFKNIKLRPITH
jgi:Domain of Unknown Function (DUF1080)